MVPVQEADLEAAIKGAGPWQPLDGSLVVPTQPEQPALQTAMLPPHIAAAASKTMQQIGTAGIQKSTAAAAFLQGIPAQWGSQTEQDTGATDPVGAAIDLLVTLARVY